MARSQRRASRADPKPQVAQLHVVLEDSDPPVWRRLEVPYDIPLDVLHRILVIVMGWEGNHLHAFEVGDQTFGIPDDEFPDETIWEGDVTLRKIALAVGATFSYQYDFGDDWQHLVTVERLAHVGSGEMVPACIDGAHACPPEDVGGIHAYREMLELLSPKSKPTSRRRGTGEGSDSAHSRESYRSWLGYEFDPDEFHLRCINRELAHLLTFDAAFQALLPQGD